MTGSSLAGPVSGDAHRWADNLLVKNMNEETISGLIKEIEAGSVDFWFIKAKLPQCRQAMEWATQSQRWDLVIRIARASNYNDISTLAWRAERQGKKLSEEEKRNFCQQVQVLALEGLAAARQIEDQKAEEGFLYTLSHLSANLGQFDETLDYLTQSLLFVSLERKWDIIGREALHFGKKASASGDYVTARALYQLCLDTIDPENKHRIADVLDFVAANEMDTGNLDLAHELMERIEKLREQLDNED